MQNKVVLKQIGMDYVKMHGFHGNSLYDSQEWGSPTKSIISRVLLILEHETWYKIKT